MSGRISFLDALAQVSETDLEEIEVRLCDLEAELEALKIARKIIETKLGDRRKPRWPKAAAAVPADPPTNPPTVAEKPASPIAEAIYDLLVKEGSMPASAIAGRLNMATQGVTAAVTRSTWFTRTPEGDVAIAISG